MAVFGRKSKGLIDEIKKYTAEIEVCMNIFIKYTLMHITGKEPEEKMVELVKAVRKSEGRCDEFRRGIETMLYQKMPTPYPRGDIFNLLEELDKVPNKAEATVNFLDNLRVLVPIEIREDIHELATANKECSDLLLEAVNSLFSDVKNAMERASDVERTETKIDKMERRLIRKIFDMDIDLAYKLLLRELVIDLTAISDRAENASDRIEILVLKLKA